MATWFRVAGTMAELSGRVTWATFAGAVNCRSTWGIVRHTCATVYHGAPDADGYDVGGVKLGIDFGGLGFTMSTVVRAAVSWRQWVTLDAARRLDKSMSGGALFLFALRPKGRRW